ncbi:uncharacterized protein TRUGW13939_08540 [Talaromyces rugulosus]|uniref:Uncharacterized protein n=1 Tax=Talaromyces rugulosus TaxID=121627 RepID=A0A7H8R4W6_TALRU|nr:uncharacterized protein TRUGW13939_08540 [Talaromyces rugulosus]QKX61392.1 hypothetical protein TRUGW13939_08540 [Talaromyces rugulosus]
MIYSPSSTSAARQYSPKQFRFVNGATRPRKRRKEHGGQSTEPEELSAATTEPLLRVTGQELEISDEYQWSNSFADLGERQEEFSSDDFALFDSLLPNIFATPSLDTELQDTSAAGLMDMTRMVPTATGDRGKELQNKALLATPSDSGPQHIQGFAFPFPSLRLGPDSTIFEVASLDYEEHLDLYDSEYCVLPLTGDIPGAVNPFRCERQTSKLSGLYAHAILALCCHHRARLAGSRSIEAAEHRRKAVQLLESAFHANACIFNDPKSWRLRSVDNAANAGTSRWDATLALISRQSPLIDRAYLDFLIGWEKQDDWSFFDLTGCPQDTLVYLVQLADLAKQREIAATMQWLTFDTAPVNQIQRELIQWHNDAGAPLGSRESYSTEEEAVKQVHEQQDRYHCAEAWRQALLLYIEVVFKSDHKKRSINVHRLVRKTIDSIRCCRRTSLAQKQLLIPVFLAGSETSDEELRDFAKEYCAYWGKKSRYNMFNSVPMIFEEIWATGKWWGHVIDSKTRPSSDHEHGTTQFLFG